TATWGSTSHLFGSLSDSPHFHTLKFNLNEGATPPESGPARGDTLTACSPRRTWHQSARPGRSAEDGLNAPPRLPREIQTGPEGTSDDDRPPMISLGEGTGHGSSPGLGDRSGPTGPVPNRKEWPS